MIARGIQHPAASPAPGVLPRRCNNVAVKPADRFVETNVARDSGRLSHPAAAPRSGPDGEVFDNELWENAFL